MKLNRIILISLAGLSALSSLVARENIGMPQGKSVSGSKAISANCTPATAQTDLDVNNVRTTILTGGDMWWDLANGQYEIPKVPAGSSEPKRHSLFAGSLWIGGIDAGGQLKVAAMTYRQTGNDFWPGPLNTSTVDIEAQVCNDWDKHFIMERSVVQEFVNAKNSPDDYPGYVTPQSIYDWPAHGDLAYGQDNYLAPFYDSDGDGYYNPDEGDYPDYDITGQQGCDAKLYGDKTLWWVFNDKGNIHTETGAEAIGLEIHAQAFGFSTNDEINNMTFYQYKVINRSTFTLRDTYFGQWVDPDLGNYTDDFVGCDVSRGLGYCYNGDENDETAAGYGTNPPAIGVDFFQGPLADEGDLIDNDLDGTVDEAGEQIIMSKFVYYNNDFTVTGNPETGTHIYNYLRGIFKDGTQMAYGGTGHQPSGTTTGILCDYMFPGDSDPNYYGTNGVPVTAWTEALVGNVPADRRFLQSAGGFTLAPGAVNTITTGVVWARATQGGAQASVDLMRLADDKAQALFDNCFRVLNGPDAPDVTVQELDKELILTLTNKSSSNNYLEMYEEHDPLIISPVGQTYDTTYNFQGYQIYQLANSTVSISDVGNPDMVRLVAQCDITDGVAKLVNYTFDQDLNANVPTLMVDGADAGIQHSFHVTKDLFAEGNDALVNHKTYYYTVVAYAYNNYKEYNMTDPNALDGQTKPYLAGRRNIKTYIVTPHHADVENNGTLIQSSYGTVPSMTREAGYGNGKKELQLTEETIEDILSSGSVANPTYTMNNGPVAIKVIDPLAIPEGTFTFELLDDTITPGDLSDAYWSLTHSNGEVVLAERTINFKNEQVIPEWGLSVDIEYYSDAYADDENFGYISADVTFENPSAPWLTGVPDTDGATAFNWIRSGTTANGDEFDDKGDPDGVYEKVLSGLVAPYSLCASNDYGPAWDQFQSLNKIDSTNSVMVVITPDKNKWTRSPVVELAPETGLAIGGAKKLNLRASASVGKDGNPDGTGNGMGWFPGYAIDLETGERLNIMFGENSWLAGENGADMIWNPTSNVQTNNIPASPLLGGMHSVYIMNADKNVPAYDQGAYLEDVLGNDPNNASKRKVTNAISWVFGFPLADERYPWLDNEVTINLHVNRPYAEGMGGLPKFSFNTDDIKAIGNNNDVAKSALDKINVVPNPYYGYSKYETSQVDNRIKITNVPEKCKINIFTVNGTKIRSYDKDDNLTSLDWDLKNDSGIPIASGLYIIHIEVEGVGEKVIKWFGVLRPIDLDTF